jgi:hypothetical protein
LGWELPSVASSDGELKKLYIQTIFPAFIVEQKRGWSDFLSTIPYYGIRNAQSRAIEFLLGLDVFEIERVSSYSAFSGKIFWLDGGQNMRPFKAIGAPPSLSEEYLRNRKFLIQIVQ